MARYNQFRGEELKTQWLKYLGGKRCIDCGNNSLTISAYDFHHVKGNKQFNLSQARGKSKEEIKKELDKCVILCANCHRTRHALMGRHGSQWSVMARHAPA